MSDAAKPVWFITGCSTGFGRAIATHTLSRGYPTVVSARNPDQVADMVSANPDNALALKLDVTSQADVDAAVEAAVAKFGRVDVLVNNAGIGYFGSLEESGMEAVRQMFEINFWGLVAMTRAVLPVMRKQRSGAIVNVSSIGGLRGGAGVSFYNATKFAVEGSSEALSHEVAPLGIKVMLVEPSGFRTDWAGRSADDAPQTIDDYRDTSGKRIGGIRASSGNQPGDPALAAEAIVAAVEAREPPLRLLLGKGALDGAREKIAAMSKNFDAWAKVAEGADRPA